MTSDTYCHIYNRANGRENLFREYENYRYFLQQWHKYVTRVAQTLDYCLMPNHFHIFVKVDEETDIQQQRREKRDLQGFQNLEGFKGLKISQQFSNLFNYYNEAYNKRYGRKGNFFSPNFKKKAFASDDYVATVTVYIRLSPAHHGFAGSIKEKPCSCYAKPTRIKLSFLNKAAIINRIGGIRSFTNYRKEAETDLLKWGKRFLMKAIPKAAIYSSTLESC